MTDAHTDTQPGRGIDTLYVSDVELARRLGIGEKTARDMLTAFKKDPRFPKKDPLFGNKRYWPKVRAFLDAREGLNVAAAVTRPRGEEYWDEAEAARRRRSGPSLASAR